MSRKFLSGSSKKSGKKSGSMGNMSKLLRSKAMSRDELIKDKSSHSNKGYDEMLQDLLDEKMFSSGSGANGFHLPGTKKKEEREMTKGMKMAMEMTQMKLLKKRQKGGKKGGIEIRPQSFGMGADGGRITPDGKIMANDGRILFRVDKQSGKITDNMGKLVGKYKAGSIVNDTKIENLIKGAVKQQGAFNPFAAKE